MSPSAPPFSRLLADNQDALYRYCVASVGRQEAADCFQEVVLAALRAYPPRRVDELRGWLFTIARNKAIDHHRSAARRARPVGAGGAGVAGVDGSGGADEVGEVVLSLAGDVWGAVRALPAMQRDVLVWRYAADLPYADVGRMLGCSEAAARQSARSGLKKLREVISHA